MYEKIKDEENKIDKLEFFIAIENSTGYMLKKAISWRHNVPQRLFLHDSAQEAKKVKEGHI